MKFYRHQLKSYLPQLPETITIEGFYEYHEIRINDVEVNPTYSKRIVNHSPDGFNWGYGGSGPAQLALAILMEFLPVEVALTHYQDFKNECVANWPEADFNIEFPLKETLAKLCNT